MDKKDSYLDDFYAKFSHEDLVIDAWFVAQATPDSTGVSQIASLMERTDYDWNTPNRVRTTLSALAAKPVQLWTAEGLDLYLSSVVRLDGSNPQLAARLLSALARWNTLTADKKAMVQEKLAAVTSQVSSKNVLEFLQNMQTVA